MKNTFFLSLIIGMIFLGSCSKEENQPLADYFVKYKIDGVEKFYSLTVNSPASFSYDAGNNIYSAILTGTGPGSTGTTDFVTINVRSHENFVTNSRYNLQDPINISGIDFSTVVFTYADMAGQLYNAVLLQISFPNLGVKDNAHVTFTNISADIVEGTFDALVLGPVNSTTGRGSDEKVVTEGQFRLKLLNFIP